MSNSQSLWTTDLEANTIRYLNGLGCLTIDDLRGWSEESVVNLPEPYASEVWLTWGELREIF